MQSKIDKIYNTVDICSDIDVTKDRLIDINNLHSEIQLNGDLCFKYNKERAKLQKITDQLHELKKQTRSQLMLDCVSDPSLCDPKTAKYTDKKAEVYYRLHSDYISVVDALIHAENELNLYESMQKIMEDKKWLIKDAVALALSNYFESTESAESRHVLDIDDISSDVLADVKVETEDQEKLKKTEEKAIDSTSTVKTKRKRRRI